MPSDTSGKGFEALILAALTDVPSQPGSIGNGVTEHEDDIIRRVREVLEVIWKNRAEAIEREACEILGVRELRDFADKLRRAANLRLDFDLNDGVILNIAPLWELVPWSEPKKYLEELQEGKYDWSHIAYQLWLERVKELCKKDRSIAIAHGREDLYKEVSSMKKAEGRGTNKRKKA